MDVPRELYSWKGRVSPLNFPRGVWTDPALRCSFFQWAKFDDDGEPPWAQQPRKTSTGNSCTNEDGEELNREIPRDVVPGVTEQVYSFLGANSV